MATILPQGSSIFDKHVENEYVRFDKLSALVIDDISSMRHAIRTQLQSIGMNSVGVAVNAHEALELIGVNTYDVILCDYNLNKSSSGQHFLEYLRNENLLSATTLFIMLTAETEYSFVANAVEFIPDDYLLKPCSETKLRSRLERLIDRRTYLIRVLKAMDIRRYDVAIHECNKLLATAADDRRRMDVLRRKAEAQLKLEDYTAVLDTYARAATIRADAPWILLGMARAHYALGDSPQASSLASELIDKNKNYVAAYELLAKVRLEADDEEGAFDLLLRSSVILPSAKRLRSVAQAAFLLGRLDEAKANAEAAIQLSTGSMVERSGDYLSLAQTLVDMGDHKSAISTLEKNARKHGDEGIFGVAKGAILAQAYFDAGEREKAKKLMDRSISLLASRKNSFVMTALGKAALKVGDVILGLKLLTKAIQCSGKDEMRIARHVKKSMVDTGQKDKVEDVIDGGRKRILLLVDEATKLMRTAHFEEANQMVVEALDIQEENIETLMTAAQLHLLWLKHEGLDDKIMARAKTYLSMLDKLVPNNQKVMNFYRFFNEIASK
ncbi:MAG: response regulator [Gallionella sp.]|nr:response regulator [Gallionella sp.]